MTTKISQARGLGIPVVSEDFLKNVEEGGDVQELLTKHCITPWETRRVSKMYSYKLKRAFIYLVPHTGHHVSFSTQQSDFKVRSIVSCLYIDIDLELKLFKI